MTQPPYGDGGPAHVPKIIILAEAQNWRCAYCATPMDYTTGQGHRHGDREASVDHVIPKAHGGKATWGNEVAACQRCNTLKGDMPAAYMLEALALHPGRDRASFKAALRHMTRCRAEDKGRAKRRAKRQRKRARRRAARQQADASATPT